MRKSAAVMIFMAVFLSLNGYAETRPMPPTAMVKVSDDHHAVLLKLSNSTPTDMFCDSIELDVVMAGRDFNDFVGRVKLPVENLYLAAGQSVDLNGLGSATNLQSSGVDGVATADLVTDKCHEAKFNEYCAYAEKSSDDAYTTDQILRAARLDCNEAETKIGDSLDLSGRNVKSLTAIGFLTNLSKLDLEKNKIDNLSPLRHLEKLTQLNVNENPVKDLSPVLELVSIQRVKANRTLVAKVSDPNPSVRGHKVIVELDETPYKRNKK